MHSELDFIGYGRQWIDSEDIESVQSVLKSDLLTQGPKVKEFEQALCDKTGAKYCIVVANGTAALHLAVAALEIHHPAHGITSPNTFLSSANAMVYNGIRPDFCDIDSTTYCMDPDKIETQILTETQLLIPVHFAGQACDMEYISTIARNKGIHIIEDAAHAIGSRYANHSHVGNCQYSDMTIFSFHPVKTITSGEGGAITTNNEQFYQSLTKLREHGISRNTSAKQELMPWHYEMNLLGYNYRLTEIQAALGLSQLNKLDFFLEKRRAIIYRYNDAFQELDWLTPPVEKVPGNSGFHLYVIQIDFGLLGMTRGEVMATLKHKGIGSQVHYIPVHTQPFYKDNFGFKKGDFPIAENYYEKVLSIPLFPKMTEQHINRVIEAVMSLKPK